VVCLSGMEEPHTGDPGPLGAVEPRKKKNLCYPYIPSWCKEGHFTLFTFAVRGAVFSNNTAHFGQARCEGPVTSMTALHALTPFEFVLVK
jgi:hypothetical protein